MVLFSWKQEAPASIGGGTFTEPLKCSFCNKTQHEVRKLIAGSGVYICDECVELCCEILDEEFKENHNHGALKHICNHKRDCDD